MYTLYRAYTKFGELLYVGLTENFTGRLRQHSKNSEWFPEASRFETETFETKEELQAAEILAITVGKPRYNIMHNKPHKSVATLRSAPVVPHRNAVSNDTEWRNYAPYGHYNCSVCGYGVVDIWDERMTIPEMVAAIERDSDIKDGVTYYCLPCYSGLRLRSFRDNDFCGMDDNMKLHQRAAAWIAAEGWRRDTEQELNSLFWEDGFNTIDDTMRYAEHIVAMRKEGQAEFKDKHRMALSKCELERHFGWSWFRTDPLWPILCPAQRPIEVGQYIIYRNNFGGAADAWGHKNTQYRWDENSKIITSAIYDKNLEDWRREESGPKEIGTASSYDNFLGIIIPLVVAS
jgi:hypothetical protein